MQRLDKQSSISGHGTTVPTVQWAKYKTNNNTLHLTKCSIYTGQNSVKLAHRKKCNVASTPYNRQYTPYTGQNPVRLVQWTQHNTFITQEKVQYCQNTGQNTVLPIHCRKKNTASIPMAFITAGSVSKIQYRLQFSQYAMQKIQCYVILDILTVEYCNFAIFKPKNVVIFKM